MSSHRYSKFWWQDWQRDPALRMCSPAARGVWMDMLAIMFDAQPQGHLLVNSRCPSDRQLASVFGCAEKEAKSFIKELEDAGVFSRTDDGVIFNRRMVRDKAISDEAEANGKRGGNPFLKGSSKKDLNHPSKPGGLSKGVNPTPYTQEAESESESERKQAAREPEPNRQPSRSDPPDRWMGLTEKWEVDPQGIRRPVVGGSYLDVTANLVCQAAKINEPNWRGDWRPLIGWLRDGIDGQAIVETVRSVAARPSYRPPASLAYFDQAVRERRSAVA